MFAGSKTKYNMLLSTTSKLQKLQKKSANALGVFQKTIADLAVVNKEIQTEIDYNTDQVNKLRLENEEYKKGLKQNESFISKINEFLGQ